MQGLLLVIGQLSFHVTRVADAVRTSGPETGNRTLADLVGQLPQRPCSTEESRYHTSNGPKTRDGDMEHTG